MIRFYSILGFWKFMRRQSVRPEGAEIVETLRGAFVEKALDTILLRIFSSRR